MKNSDNGNQPDAQAALRALSHREMREDMREIIRLSHLTRAKERLNFFLLTALNCLMAGMIGAVGSKYFF